MGKKQTIGFNDFLNFILELHFHITKSLAALEVYFYDTYKFQIKDWKKLEIYLSIQSITSEVFTQLKELLYQDLANISLLRTSKEAIEKILNGFDYENVKNYGKKMSFDECFLDFQGIVDDLYNNYDCSEASLANNIYHDSQYASLKYYEASRYGIRGLIILVDDIYNLKPHFKTEDIEYWRRIKGFVLPNLVEIQEFEEVYCVDFKYRVRFQDFYGKPAIWEEEYDPHNEYNPNEEREFESEGTYDEFTNDYDLEDGGICPFGIHKAKLIDFFNDEYETLELIFRIDNKRYSFSANWYEDADTDEPPNNYELIHWLYNAFGNPIKRKGNSLEELLISLDINGSVGNTYLIKTYYGFSGNQIDYDFYPKLCDNEFEDEDDSFDYEEDSFTNSSNDITDIDNSIYEECIESGDLIISENVKTIGDYEFSDDTSITSFVIPNTVTIIGDSAFEGCSSLTSITIPNGVTSIGDFAFEGCSSLTSITIPNSVTSIGVNAFGGAFDECNNLANIIVGRDNKVYDSRNNCNAIIETKTNTLIKGCKSTIIPNSVTSIGDDAFKGCTNLTSIIIPNSVTSIGEFAFSGCKSLTSITIPNSVTSIGEFAFSGCKSLTSITIPNSVTSIGYVTFQGCSGLTCMTVSNDNTAYDSRDNCNAIIETSTNTLIAGCKNTIIPNSVTSLGDYAFSRCKSLTSITIPNSVTSIGVNAFYGCSSLTSIVISNSVTSIGDYAFFGCASLTNITIPNSVTIIGDNAFKECTNLTSIIIPDSVTIIESEAFSGCSSLTNITIPDSVTSIGNNAFKGCSGLTSIVIPDSVTSIGDYAFSGCKSLTRITIPNIVTNIGSYAFSNCDNLETVFYKGNEEQYCSSSLAATGTPINAIIYYYSDSFPKENGNYWHYVNGVATIWK